MTTISKTNAASAPTPKPDPKTPFFIPQSLVDQKNEAARTNNAPQKDSKFFCTLDK